MAFKKVVLHGDYFELSKKPPVPVDPTAVSSPGEGWEASRNDHQHGGANGTGSGSGGGVAPLTLSNNNPQDTAASPDPGGGSQASRDDHVHVSSGGSVTLSNNNPEDVGYTPDPGAGTEASRDDHVHKIPDPLTLGELDADYVNVNNEVFLAGTTSWVNFTGIDADQPIMKLNLTSDVVTADPTIDPVAGWIKIRQGGVDVYIPVYTIDGT